MAKIREFTDAHISELFADESLKNRYLWAEGIGWLRWTGVNWNHAHVSEIREQARQWAKAHYESAVAEYRRALATDAPNKRVLEELVGEWGRYTDSSKIGSLVSLAQGIVSKVPGEFDADPFALNCQNGIVDLRTGELREHDPAQLVRKVTDVAYRPGATHADWDQALSAVPDDTQAWYQLRLGQGIIGQIPRDDLILVQVGGGANGKSTILSAIQATIGGYFLVVSPRALTGNGDEIPTEVADFQGIRFASLEELPEERQLPTTKVKIMAGTPTITARRMRQDPVTFETTHTLVISTNYPPAVVETDTGTWRRLCQVPFPYHFVKSKDDLKSENDRLGDPTIRERLREDIPAREAVLAWLVNGAVKACEDYDAFKCQPRRVADATLEWRKMADQVLGYVDDALDFEPDSAVLVTELLANFNNWLLSGNQHNWSSKTFAARFGGHEEVAAHGVKRAVIRRERARAILSRPHGYETAPLPDGGTCKVWLGVAFRPAESEEKPDLLSEQWPDAA